MTAEEARTYRDMAVKFAGIVGGVGEKWEGVVLVRTDVVTGRVICDKSKLDEAAPQNGNWARMEREERWSARRCWRQSLQFGRAYFWQP